jgi:hypothetical protein
MLVVFDLYGASLKLGRPALIYGLCTAALATAAAATLVCLVRPFGWRWACAFAAVASFWLGFTHFFVAPLVLHAVRRMSPLDSEVIGNALACAFFTGSTVLCLAGLGLTRGEEVLKQSRLAELDAKASSSSR